MTAGVGVFNKQAVVLAGDSAATIGNGRKVFNTANKIFPLQKEEKVGVFIYNNSNWMGIPIELIIKLYKDNHTRNFDKLEQYVDDFIAFLEDKMLKHIPEESLNDFVESVFFDVVDQVSDEANRIINQKIDAELIERPKDSNSEREIYELHFKEILDVYVNSLKSSKTESKNNFKNIKIKEIESNFPIQHINGFISSVNFQSKLQISKKIKQIIYLKIVNDFDIQDDFTGIVFAGYGNNEIFPSVCEVKLGSLLNKKVKFEIFGKSEISFDNKSFIAPFAQREMAATFMEGINPIIEEEFSEDIINKLHDLEQKINSSYKISKKKLNQLFSETYSDIIDSFQMIKHEKMVKPVIETVSMLKKEDLIELAESLVGMTALKRKTTLDIETVGGPIDIAIITKDEGFVWVKRKEKFYNE